MKTRALVLLVYVFVASSEMMAQCTYSLDLDVPRLAVRRGHLGLGDESVAGERVAVNNQYIELSGSPWIAVSMSQLQRFIEQQ